MSRAPSIVPQDADHDTYIVLDASGLWVGRGFHETGDEDDRETLIHDLLDGPVPSLACVLRDQGSLRALEAAPPPRQRPRGRYTACLMPGLFSLLARFRRR